MIIGIDDGDFVYRERKRGRKLIGLEFLRRAYGETMSKINGEPC